MAIDKEKLNKALQEEMEYYKTLDPKERANYLAIAMRFCLRHRLFTLKEREQMAADPEYAKKNALKALYARQFYRQTHPEE